MLAGMVGQSAAQLDLFAPNGIAIITGALLFALVMPNSLEVARYVGPSDDRNLKGLVGKKIWLAWKPGGAWAILTAVLLLISIMNLWRTSEFLYFQF